MCAANMTETLMLFSVPGNFLEQMGAKLDQHAAPAFVALQGFLTVWYPWIASAACCIGAKRL